MNQFYENYKDFPKLSTLLRQISWSHNLAIFQDVKQLKIKSFTSKQQPKKITALESLIDKYQALFSKEQ